MKLLSFQFNYFHFKCSIPTCFFFYHLLSLLNIYYFYKKSVNWIDTILIITYIHLCQLIVNRSFAVVCLQDQM